LVKTEEDRAWLAHNKLRQSSSKAIDGDLMATWLVFAGVIADKHADERRLHDFILKRPILLSEFGEHGGDFFIGGLRIGGSSGKLVRKTGSDGKRAG